MFKTKGRNYNRSKYGNNAYASRSHSQRRNNGQGKKLDPTLFVKKAIKNDTQIEFVSSSRFADYDIVDKLKRNIEEHGYSAPTAIQEKAIPEILAGRDIIGVANTGTGKTAAFLISIINKAYLDRNQRVLIVVPTRELAIQIRDEFHLFAKGTDLEAVAIIGGSDIKRQTYALRHRPHFVIGTPGRLKDLIERRVLQLSLFQNNVLNEV